MMNLIRVALSTMAISSVLADQRADDEVKELVNMTSFGLNDTYKMYSGMLDITTSANKSLHYIFVESQNDKTNDPTILWFNGGPGCSSMLAFMQEHGPWVMDDGEETFHENPYSWNTNANVLYIEMPAGVGFSYCNTTLDDCTYYDNNTATENLVALNEWFDRFPDFKTNDLYLSGESYAGVYVPFLLNEIHDYNQNHTDDAINLKGMMVGNGCTNWTYDALPGTVDMGYWRSLYSQDTYDNIQKEQCEYAGVEFNDNPSESCMGYLDEVNNAIAGLNIYNIYGKCYGGAPTEEQ